jgi:hypothetical protein
MLKLGMKSEVRMEPIHWGEKEGIKLVFSPKLVLKGVSPLILDSIYLRLDFWSYASLNQTMSQYIMQIL